MSKMHFKVNNILFIIYFTNIIMAFIYPEETVAEPLADHNKTGYGFETDISVIALLGTMVLPVASIDRFIHCDLIDKLCKKNSLWHQCQLHANVAGLVLPLSLIEPWIIITVIFVALL